MKTKKSGTLRSRSSRPEVFCKKGVLRNFAKFIGKHMCQSFVFNKVVKKVFIGISQNSQENTCAKGPKIF